MTGADNNHPESPERSTIETLKAIQSGKLDPDAIGTDDRRRLVEYLTAEGYSKADMATIVKVSERTVERDRKSIREANAIGRHPDLLPQMVGRLVAEAELAIQQIRKTSRERTVAAATKIDAYHRCYQIQSDLTSKLQSLGYLPIATARLQADVTHSIGDLPGLDDVDVQFQQLAAAAAASSDPQVSRQLEDLNQKITNAKLASELTRLQGQTAEEEHLKGDTND